MAKPTKIAYLTGEYPRATDTFIQREIAQLRTQGFDVRPCSIRETGVEHLVGPEQKAEADRTFHVLKSAMNPAKSIAAHLRALAVPKRYFNALRTAAKLSPGGVKAFIYHMFYFCEAVVLADFMRRNDIVHLHNHIAKSSCTVALLCKQVSGIPFSFTLHGPDIFFEPIHWRLDQKIAEASFVACISDFCRSQGMSFGARNHWSRMHVVHCGVDPSRYDGHNDRAGNRLLFVGRLAAVKGVPVLFEALREVLNLRTDVQLTLIGDGPERQMLEAEAAAAGLSDRIEFLGYKSQSDVAEVLSQVDALVLPSFAEGVPVVLMEAMAARLPVITTQIAGIPELVEDGESGVLVPPGDAGALTSAIMKVLGEPELAKTMGEKGRAKVEAEFNVESEARWLGQLIKGYLNDSPPVTKRPEETS